MSLDDGARSVDFRFDLVDGGGTAIGQLAVLQSSPPTIDLDTTRAVVRTLQNVVVPTATMSAVDAARARVRPVMIVDGAEYHLGVFVFADASAVSDATAGTTTSQLFEVLSILDQPVPYTVAVTPGAPIQTIIGDLLASFGLTLSTTVFATVATPAVFPPGQGNTLLTTCNALCLAAGCLPLHCDGDGVVLLRRPPLLDAVDVRYGPGGAMVYDGSIVTSQVLSQPNRWIAVNTGGTGETIVGVYDLPSDAPGSAFETGRVIARAVDVQGLPDQDAAEAAAYAASVADRGASMHVAFTGPPDPRHVPFAVVELNGVAWREQSWSMTMIEGGGMSHELRSS